jgi:hypothetical protein
MIAIAGHSHAEQANLGERFGRNLHAHRQLRDGTSLVRQPPTN